MDLEDGLSSWTNAEKSLFRVLARTFGCNFCVIATCLRTKSCQQVTSARLLMALALALVTLRQLCLTFDAKQPPVRPWESKALD